MLTFWRFSMKVVLAEKPSVARDLAKYLKATRRGEGYLEGNGIVITWAIGHLVGLKEPDEYDPAFKKWQIATLPIIPETFELKTIGDQGIKKQFNIVKGLFQKADEIICATDAGREGELIFRYILKLAKCEKKPFRRLWLSSLTDEAIAEAFANLKAGEELNSLYEAARCRSEADWIVGLNATRNMTVRYGRGGHLWSVGRVQTPVLTLIVERDISKRHFIPKPFWELQTKYKGAIFKQEKKRFEKKEEGEEALAKIKEHPLEILNVKSKKESVPPPLLPDLTDLQREMNKKYGFSAQDTLQMAQTLYERKLITYPRTDSRHLSPDMKKQMPELIGNLSKSFTDACSKIDKEKLSYPIRFFNAKKVTDHHAIIPTGKMPGQLAPNEQKVYEQIVYRFLSIFYPDFIKEIQTINAKAEKEPFTAKGLKVLQEGWTVLLKSKEEDQILPAMEEGEKGPHKPFLKEGKTKPPAQFTENSLLLAMETAGKLIEEDELKDALKEKGLGTPATRAQIIETLIKRGYIKRQKKNVVATDLGRYLIALIQDPALKSAEMTGEWEAKLKKIEYGNLDAKTFMDEIVSYTKHFIASSNDQGGFFTDYGKCPLCEKPIMKGKKAFGCSGYKEGCTFVFWNNIEGVRLTDIQVKTFLNKRTYLSPLRNEKGETGILYLSREGLADFIPYPEPPKRNKRFANSYKRKKAPLKKK